MHSCFKVTDTILQDFATALHANGNTDNNWHDDGHTLSTARSGDSQAQRNSTTAAAVAGVHAEAGVQEADSSNTVPPLQRLDLSYTRVRDGGVPHLVAALPRLSWLGLKGCNVGDDGLQHLLRLPHLTALHIKHCHRCRHPSSHTCMHAWTASLRSFWCSDHAGFVTLLCGAVDAVHALSSVRMSCTLMLS
jgi:hypothetical protein